MQRTITLLTAAVLILATIGLVMLASASMVKGAAEESFNNNPAYFVHRQGVWMALALGVAVFCARFNLRWMKAAALPLAAMCVVLLVLVRIPGIGMEVKGSWRWLHFGPFRAQPSEFAKIGIILASAWWISRRRRYMDTFRRGILVPMLGLGLFAGLLLVEPDFGTTVLVGLTVLMLLYAGGARPFYLIAFSAFGTSVFGLLLALNPNRMHRIIAFMNPEKYVQGSAWQLVNALDAFASGGLQGVGLGNSIQKYHYLPEAHTDFILPIIGE
jgi:cell division protein FtsW